MRVFRLVARRSIFKDVGLSYHLECETDCGGGSGGGTAEATFVAAIGVVGMCDMDPIPSPTCGNTNEIEWRVRVDRGGQAGIWTGTTRQEGIPTHTFLGPGTVGFVQTYYVIAPYRPRASNGTVVHADVVETDLFGSFDTFGSIILSQGGETTWADGDLKCGYYPQQITLIPACPLRTWRTWQASYAWSG